MWTALFITATSFACTGDSALKVVGFDAAGTQAVVRIESSNDGGPSIELAVLDLQQGAKEIRRFIILAPEDGGDATIRGANWTAAETELKGMGLVADGSPTPVEWKGGVPGSVAVSGAELVFAYASKGDGDDTSKLLIAGAAKKGERVGRWEVLADWPWYSNPNAQHDVSSVWAVPGKNLALVVEGAACMEPTVHVVALPRG
jgi:hypothetical protein